MRSPVRARLRASRHGREQLQLRDTRQLPTAMQASTVALATMLNNAQGLVAAGYGAGPASPRMGIMAQFLTLADTYIPLIAQAATKNFTIMTASVQATDRVGEGPADMGIFKNLENLFAQSIPTGVNVLTQFVELLAKIANWAAPQSGSFLTSISNFLTRSQLHGRVRQPRRGDEHPDHDVPRLVGPVEASRDHHL